MIAETRMSYFMYCLLLAPALGDAAWGAEPPGNSPRQVSAPSSAQPLWGTAMPPAPTSATAGHPPDGPTRELAAAAGTVAGSTHSAPRDTLQLPPPSRQSPEGRWARPASGGGAATTVFGSLAVVLAAFFAVAWLSRRGSPQRLAPLPGEVLECLGRANLTARQQMQLLRVGRKLILVSVTATDSRTLTEVTDPVEVDRLAGLCQQQRAESISASFRQVLAQCAGEPRSGNSYLTTSVPRAEPAPRVDTRAATGERRA